jgi:hypothetical protein
MDNPDPQRHTGHSFTATALLAESEGAVKEFTFAEPTRFAARYSTGAQFFSRRPEIQCLLGI